MKILFPLILIALFFNSCGINFRIRQKSLDNNTVENWAIPSDFGTNVQVFAILLGNEENDLGRFHRNYRKFVEKNVNKVYKGEYVLVNQSEFHKSYDAKKYRYYIFYDLTSSTQSLSQGSITFYDYEFYIRDRRSNYKYESKVKANHWGEVWRGYMMNLDKERLKWQTDDQKEE